MANKVTIDQLAQGQTIAFLTTRGAKAIGRITSIDTDKNTVLCHKMIYIDNFSPLKGRFGGLVISVSDIRGIVDTSFQRTF